MFMKKSYTNRTFSHNYFTPIETFKEDDCIWFALPDIAHNLGLHKFRSIAEILISPENISVQNKQREMSSAYVRAININGIYELMGSSLLNDNENSAFLDWLLNEIIPVLNGEEPVRTTYVTKDNADITGNITNELEAAFKTLTETMLITDTNSNIIEIHTNTSDNNYNMSNEKYFDTSGMNVLSSADWIEIVNRIVDHSIYNPALTFDTFKKQRNNFMDNAFKEFQLRSGFRGLKSKACQIRNRMLADGKSYCECDLITSLDIISRNTSYREMFESVLNDMLMERKIIQKVA